MSPLTNLQDKELLQSSASRKGEQPLVCKVAQTYTSHINKKIEKYSPSCRLKRACPPSPGISGEVGQTSCYPEASNSDMGSLPSSP